MKLSVWSGVVLGMAAVIAASNGQAANTATHIVVQADKQSDAGIALALNDLTAALKSVGHDAIVAYQTRGAAMPEADVIIVGEVEEDTQAGAGKEADGGFRIHPRDMSGGKAAVIKGGPRGLMYGVFKMAERIRLGDDPWQINLKSAPAFPLRIFSEEGQLLDIPDKAYYAETAPYVDEKRMRNEVDQLKQLMRHVAAQGFNAFCLLHLNVEEYIDYRYLDKEVYGKEDRHRVRSPVFCKYLTELCDAAHALHMEFHIQVYEFVYPPRLAELYKLELGHPDLGTVLNARYKELFERVPLDRMIVTAGEQASRCGYVPKLFWEQHDAVAAGKMARLYNEVCRTAGGKCIFRLWRVAGDAKQAAEVFRTAGPEVTFESKNTGGDFFIHYPLTSIVSEGLTKEQPTIVTFDTFREYDGWSRLFCYMKEWGPRVRACRDNGVVGINAWGPWSPACNVRDLDGVTWAGHWNNFRTFLRGFTPGQAHVYLIGRLAWDPDADVAQIARDFCTLHIGQPNAEAGAEALMATEDAFREEYVKEAHPCYLKWTVVYWRQPALRKWAFDTNSLPDILASNARALAAVDRMEQAFTKTDATKAPDAEKYRRFKEGVEKTAVYLRTFYAFREGLWRTRAANTLTGADQQANATALAEVRLRLKPLFDRWQRWPEEAGLCRVTYRYGEPSEASQRFFEVWNCEERRTMETDAAQQFGE